MFVVWLTIKQRMADNGWMYSGRVSATNKTDEWIRKTQFLVKELARGTKGLVEALCPCNRCNRHHRRSKEDMWKHLLNAGYMPNYVTNVDFDQRECDRSEVMRERFNGNEYDGTGNLLDDLMDAYMPDSPPPEPEAPPEPEEAEPAAKANQRKQSQPRRPSMRC